MENGRGKNMKMTEYIQEVQHPTIRNYRITKWGNGEEDVAKEIM